jgi:rubredoxin
VTRWKCRKCSYIYDPRVGDPDGGIPPGTPFERIPDSWRCPVCGVSKRDFYTLASPPPPAPRRQPLPATATATWRPDAAVPPPPARGAPPGPDRAWTVGPLKPQR